MDARAVFEASRAAYARADAYRDSGTFQRVDVASGLVEAEGTFSTSFDRASDELRFACSLVDSGLPIGGAYVSRAGRIVERDGWVPESAATLAVAAASIAGVLPPSHFVPRLLVGGALGGRALWDREPEGTAREEVVLGDNCLVVETGDEWARMEIAVGNGDFLIRRIKMPRLWLPDALRDAASCISGLSDAVPIDLDEQRLVIDYTLLP